MLADELDYVVGVDTHRDEHVLAVVAAPPGAVVARHGGAPRTRAAIASASRSRASTRLAAAPGRSRAPAATAPALPATSPAAARRCSRSAAHRGPSGGCAARTTRSTRSRTARAALASETLALPRAGERREALRLLLVARRSAVDVRREALDTAARRDRYRTRPAPRGAARTPGRKAARALQPPSPLKLGKRRRARDTARVAQPRPPNRSGDRSKPTSSNARSSATSARSHQRCSTSPASARSSPPS